MTDTLAACVAFLRADAGVIGVVGTKVWGAEIPPNQAMPCKSILIRGAGGLGETSYLQLGQPRFDISCFGKTMKEAMTVYLSVAEAMKYLERDIAGDTFLHNAQMSAGPSTLRDPDTNWPYIFSSWIFLMSEKEV